MLWQMQGINWQPGSGHTVPGEGLVCAACGGMEWFITWELGEPHVSIRCASCAAVFDVAGWRRVYGQRRWPLPSADIPLASDQATVREGGAQ